MFNLTAFSIIENYWYFKKMHDKLQPFLYTIIVSLLLYHLYSVRIWINHKLQIWLLECSCCVWSFFKAIQYPHLDQESISVESYVYFKLFIILFKLTPLYCIWKLHRLHKLCCQGMVRNYASIWFNSFTLIQLLYFALYLKWMNN